MALRKKSYVPTPEDLTFLKTLDEIDSQYPSRASHGSDNFERAKAKWAAASDFDLAHGTEYASFLHDFSNDDGQGRLRIPRRHAVDIELYTECVSEKSSEPIHSKDFSAEKDVKAWEHGFDTMEEMEKGSSRESFADKTASAKHRFGFGFRKKKSTEIHGIGAKEFDKSDCVGKPSRRKGVLLDLDGMSPEGLSDDLEI